MPAAAATFRRLTNSAETLRAELDREPANPIHTGGGTALALSGWCFHPEQSIRQLQLEFDGIRMPVELHGIQRRELRDQFDSPMAEWSGFAAVIPIPACHGSREVELTLHAQLHDGRAESTSLAALKLRPGATQERPECVRSPRGRARTVVCMTTYNPRPDLFARQIETLREQSDRDWSCIICDDHSRPDRFAAIRATIGDDPRFALYRQSENRGFYRNFEQCLALAPADCDFVALADQDDAWHSNKLATLREAFSPRTQLVYSDARIVESDGTVHSPTYWTTRRPNRGDFDSLLIANTVTGAAAMMRRSLLDFVLPFPPEFGAAFHDHWLALGAIAAGGIEYIDRPLYDYVQHGGNVIGHVAPAVLPLWTRAWRWAKFFWPLKVARNIKVALGNGRTHFFDNWLRLRQLSLALRERSANESVCDRALSIPALVARGLKSPSGVSTTVGMEFHLLHARLWAAYMRCKRALVAPSRGTVACELNRNAA